jgi:tellurite resistance protein TerC
MDKPLWMWVTFIGIVFCLLALDLGIFHRKQKEISIKDSLRMSAFYIAIACLFGVWIWHQLGAQSAKEYMTGYLVEKSLSLDNIFLISLIFSFFTIPLKYQHRVLFWGILGVIMLRAIMISLGATLIAEFSWILYFFAVFLMATGLKMLFVREKPFDINANPLLKLLRRYVRITPQLHGKNFFIKQLDPTTGKYQIYWTPLLVTLIMIEFIDIIFAVDSVPAIFALTTDSYIVYTSNIFAILGLRALYFAVAVIIHRFEYLKYALAAVLVFIGSKIFIADLLGLEKFPASVSLSITLGLLATGVLYSLYKTRKTI